MMNRLLVASQSSVSSTGSVRANVNDAACSGPNGAWPGSTTE